MLDEEMLVEKRPWSRGGPTPEPHQRKKKPELGPFSSPHNTRKNNTTTEYGVRILG